MKKFEYKSLTPLPHPSGWPWMTAKCCGSRINHIHGEPIKLGMPNKYGDTIATHTQERGCKCGKVSIIVEGTIETWIVSGCIGFKK